MSILVTGGAGFIGSNLCEAILELGYKVRCLDDLSTGNTRMYRRAAGNYLYSRNVFPEAVRDSVCIKARQAIFDPTFYRIYYSFVISLLNILTILMVHFYL